MYLLIEFIPREQFQAWKMTYLNDNFKTRKASNSNFYYVIRANTDYSIRYIPT